MLVSVAISQIYIVTNSFLIKLVGSAGNESINAVLCTKARTNFRCV